MKYLFSFFLLIVILISVAAPLVEQLRGYDRCELGKDNTADEDTTIEKEKDMYTFKNIVVLKIPFLNLKKLKRQIHFESDNLISELHTFLPELPPEV